MVPWAQGKRRLTHAYAVFLARWTRRLSWREVGSIYCTKTRAGESRDAGTRGNVKTSKRQNVETTDN